MTKADDELPKYTKMFPWPTKPTCICHPRNDTGIYYEFVYKEGSAKGAEENTMKDTLTPQEMLSCVSLNVLQRALADVWLSGPKHGHPIQFKCTHESGHVDILGVVTAAELDAEICRRLDIGISWKLM
jgi:hypothetical protein